MVNVHISLLFHAIIALLQTLSQFNIIPDLSLHLIEVSPKMKLMQKSALCDNDDVCSSQSAQEDIPAANQPLSTKYNNINVSWHKSIGKLLCKSICKGI